MKKYTIAKYIRLSMEDLDLCDSEEKAESVSISNQRNFINVFMEQKEEFKGAEVREFVDDGYSGTNFDRPAMKEMLRLCKQGEINCIIVKDLSRFGRNYLEVGDYLEQTFPFLGIRFISINDGFDSKNFFGQTGGMDVAFKNFIYEMYSRDLSEKVKSGVTTCMKRGEYYAGCMVYGYQKSSDGKRMEVDEGAAVTIRRIFQELADGKDAKTLAIELNAEGVPTRLTYKQAKGEQLNRHYKADIWNRNKIHSIIHNRVYQGDMVYRKAVRTQIGCKQKVRQPEEKWLVIPDHHEAIVPRSMFEAVRRELDRRQANRKAGSRPSARYWCSGKVVCGRCGSRFVPRRGAQADGALRWVCGKRVQHGVAACAAPAVGNQILLNCMKQIVQDLPINIEVVLRQTLRAIPDLTRAERQRFCTVLRHKLYSETVYSALLDHITATGRVRTAVFRPFGQRKTVRAAHGRLNTIRFSFRVRRNHRGTSGARRRTCNRASYPDLPRGYC